jgi:uncharacterized protein YjbI with pentapeptide repeats
VRPSGELRFPPYASHIEPLCLEDHLLGAGLRNANLGGADLSRALYLTQPHINAARGDLRTLLPADLASPSHWG